MIIRIKDKNYERSNAVTKIDFPISVAAKKLTKKILNAKSSKTRQKLGDMLLDELADLACIDIVNLKISNKKQWHKKVNNRVVYKQYGYYKPGSKYIYITNKTAVRGQTLAPKTFLDTMLHEWIHHYDHHKLKLNSIHTSGFYARLKDLKTRTGYYDA